jgi:hypothetical protein
MTTVKENLDAALVDAATSELAGKKFWASKTFWANVVAAAAVALQIKWGFVLGPEYQMLVLTLVNLGLRKITNEPIVW